MKTTSLIAAIAVLGGSAASAGAVMVPVAAQPMAAAPQISAVFELYGGIGTYANISGSNDDLVDLEGNPSLFGGSARVSIPWTHSFSTQLDLDADTAVLFDQDEDQYASSTIGTLHASYRGSDNWMLGVFAGGGTASVVGTDEAGLLKFAGVEGQYYFNNFTLYAQIGYLDSIEGDGGYSDTFHAASFVRGVGRYFINDKTMVQAEVAYAAGKQDSGSSYDMDVISYGVRAQREFDLGNVPLTVFAAYEGAQYSNGTESDNGEFTENNFLAGVQFRFGTSSMIENDRHGASLSTPNFGRWVAAGETID